MATVILDMPIKSCKLPGGKDGFQWGDHGTCYVDRSKAEAQAAAAHANGFVGDSGEMAAGIALIRDGSVLLMQRSVSSTYGGLWSLPGGKVEEGEQPDDAACRELYEETGISIEPGDLRYLSTDPEGEMDFLAFIAPAPASANVEIDQEHGSFGWFPLNALPQPLHPSLVKSLGSGLLHAGVMAQDIETCAMDRDSVREYDKVGRLRVEMSNISKANVCDYYGREIPHYKELGLNPDKIYKLLRDPVELAKAAPTFNGIQLLYTHTPVSAADPKKEYVVGCTGSDAVFNPPYLQNSLVFWDNAAIAAIETFEMNQLSSSYHYDADMTPGDYEGVAYDGRMINIVGNHVALVKVGRAGADVVVGDSQPLEHSNMTKKTSAKAVAQRAALGAYLRPALANDSAPIPYDRLLKANASPLVTARATAAHYKTKFEVNPKELANILQLAADEAPDDDAEDEEEETEEERKEREAKEMAAKDKKAKDEADPKKPVDRSLGKDKEEDDDDKDKDKEDRTAADAALVKRMQNDFKALRQAERDVAPLVGEVAAMDSAEEVYRYALGQVGVPHKGVHTSALGTLVGMARTQAKAPTLRAVPAMDSDARSEFSTKYAGASQIKRI